MNPEPQIISILLNRPDDQGMININADWFTDVDYRWIFEAIHDHQNTNLEPLIVYGYIKTKHPTTQLTVRKISELKENYLNDIQLDSLTAQLHRQYLIGALNQQMQLCQQAPIPENYEQVTETIGQLQNLHVVSDDGSIDAVLDAVKENFDHERPTGIKSLPELDQMLGGGLYGGMLLTIGARPSVGKTAFCVNLAYQIVKKDPEVQVDYFTLEMNKREMVDRFLARESGANAALLRNSYNLSDQQKRIVAASIDRYRQRQIKIYDKTPNLSDVMTIIKRHSARAKPNKYLAIVDHIGLLSVPGSEERYLQIGQITRQLKIATNEFNIPIIELSQLNRAVSNRMDKRPVLTDLRESGSIEQDSNVVGFLYEPSVDDRSIKCLSIQKNREGQTGDIYLYFMPGKMTFQVVPKDELS